MTSILNFAGGFLNLQFAELNFNIYIIDIYIYYKYIYKHIIAVEYMLQNFTTPLLSRYRKLNSSTLQLQMASAASTTTQDDSVSVLTVETSRFWELFWESVFLLACFVSAQPLRLDFLACDFC